MTKGSGSGRTPNNVIGLLKKAVDEKGQSSVARESGLTQSAIHRYLAGIGEPSSETLRKLAEYFKVSVGFLRGDFDKNHVNVENLEKGYEMFGDIAQDVFNRVGLDGVTYFECVLDDIVKKAQLESLRELVKCRDQQKK